jgi:AAA15 family ATPase/GTPase
MNVIFSHSHSIQIGQKMLIRFSVENYQSFKERAELSLVPSKVRRHPHHVIKAKNQSDISVLKSAVIYGANASGKSNLIKAMKHAQILITRGVKSGKKIPFKPFNLDTHCLSKPSRFEFEIKCAQHCYAYGFIADSQLIHEEWLYKIDKNKDTIIFERTLVDGKAHFNFDNIKFENKEDELYLNFTGKGTPENRLFINECNERNVTTEMDYLTDISEIIHWFEHQLKIIFPDTKYAGLGMNVDIEENQQVHSVLAKILSSFDTGISNLSLQEVNFEKDVVDIPDTIKQKIIDDIVEHRNIVVTGMRGTRYRISQSSSGDIQAFKLMTAHLDSEGNEKLYDIDQESDGTQRLLDIAPGLVDIFSGDRTYIIDELDRSLHPDITVSILNAFLNNDIQKSGNHNNSQLIVSTHETNLLSQQFIRKDEIWFCQKNKQGISKLYSLEEYQPRFDKDIRKGYAVGRFGGVPLLSDFKNLSWMGSDA